jgi:hypothetical protein
MRTHWLNDCPRFGATVVRAEDPSNHGGNRWLVVDLRKTEGTAVLESARTRKQAEAIAKQYRQGGLNANA